MKPLIIIIYINYVLKDVKHAKFKVIILIIIAYYVIIISLFMLLIIIILIVIIIALIIYITIKMQIYIIAQTIHFAQKNIIN